MKQLYIS